MTKTATVQAQQKWEYLEITRKTETYLTKELNDLGQQAWELVTIIYGKDRKGEIAWTAFLKRPFAGHSHGDAGHAVSAQSTSAQARAPQPASTNPQGFDLTGDEFRIKAEEIDPQSAADKAQGKSV